MGQGTSSWCVEGDSFPGTTKVEAIELVHFPHRSLGVAIQVHQCRCAAALKAWDLAGLMKEDHEIKRGTLEMHLSR